MPLLEFDTAFRQGFKYHGLRFISAHCCVKMQCKGYEPNTSLKKGFIARGNVSCIDLPAFLGKCEPAGS